MTLSTQLYANNAKSTLANSIGAIDTAITLGTGDGTKYPSPGAGQYFLATIESGSTVEIIKCTSRTGDVLTVTRGQEGTSASLWPQGALIEMRVTRQTLERFTRAQDRIAPLTTLDVLDTPANSDANSYLTSGDLDDSSAPILVLKASSTLWRFESHEVPVVTGTVTSATTTSITSGSIGGTLSDLVTGMYIVQFTSGALQGLARMVSAQGSNTFSWAIPTGTVPANGSGFQVYKSNYALLTAIATIATVSDEALAYAIALGG